MVLNQTEAQFLKIICEKGSSFYEKSLWKNNLFCPLCTTTNSIEHVFSHITWKICAQFKKKACECLIYFNCPDALLFMTGECRS